MRAAVLKNHEVREKAARYSMFTEQFSHMQKIEEKHFFKKNSDLLLFIRKKKWPLQEKNDYMEDYGIGKRRELKESEKIRHSLYECNECLLKHSCKNTFPTVAGHRNAKKSFKITNSDTNTTSKPTISLSPIKPQQNNIEIRTPLQNIINLTPANKHTLSEMKEVAGSVLQILVINGMKFLTHLSQKYYPNFQIQI